MREHHTRLVEQHDADCPEFREYAKRQSLLYPSKNCSGGVVDFIKAFEDFGSIACCVGGDGAWATVKFARWGSLRQGWDRMRPEFFFYEMVLAAMADAQTGETRPQDTTSLWDASATKDRKGGLVKKAYTYCTIELVLCMDVYVLASKVITDEDSRIASEVKSMESFVNELADNYKWQWSSVPREQIQLLNDGEACANVRRNQHAVNCGARSGGATLLYETALAITGEDLMRRMPMTFNWPAPAVCLLVDMDVRAAMEGINTEWQKCLALEAQAHADEQVRLFVSQMNFLEMPVIRLFFLVVEEDLRVGEQTRSVEMARALVVRLGDEKPPEDMHQRVRNYQKVRRFKQVSKSAIYGQCQTSGILEGRSLKTVQANAMQVAKHMHRTLLPEKEKASSAPPSQWPKLFDEILKPSKDWPTANVKNFFYCYLCMSQVEQWDGADSCELWGSWFSRLLEPLQLYRHFKLCDDGKPHFFVPLAVGKFGAMVVLTMMEHNADDELVIRLDGDSNDTIIQLHVRADEDVESVGFTVEFGDDGGLQLVELTESDDHPRYIVAAALYRRRVWSQWELRAIMYHGNANDPKWWDCKITEKELLSQVIELALGDEEEAKQKVRDLYEKPAAEAEPDDEAEMDPETMEFVTELMLTDECNGSDFKSFKDDLDRKSARRLMAKKRHYQREQAAQRKAKLKQKRTLAKTKKNINPSGRVQRRNGSAGLLPMRRKRGRQSSRQLPRGRQRSRQLLRRRQRSRQLLRRWLSIQPIGCRRCFAAATGKLRSPCPEASSIGARRLHEAIATATAGGTEGRMAESARWIASWAIVRQHS